MHSMEAINSIGEWSNSFIENSVRNTGFAVNQTMDGGVIYQLG